MKTKMCFKSFFTSKYEHVSANVNRGLNQTPPEVSSDFILFCGAVKARTGYLQAGTKKNLYRKFGRILYNEENRQIHEIHKRYQ